MIFEIFANYDAVWKLWNKDSWVNKLVWEICL